MYVAMLEIKVLSLLKKLSKNNTKFVCIDSDHPGVEELRTIAGIKHIVRKSETYLVMSYNFVSGHYLARLHRRTKRLNKSVQMI